jgi:chlorite dismutase
MEPDNQLHYDIKERGAMKDGQRQVSDRRLFMLLQVFTGCRSTETLIAALEQSRMEGVLYKDLQDARGIGLLTFREEPGFFTGELREFLNNSPFGELAQRLDLHMLGRTYSTGFEQDLEYWLLERPRRNVTNPEWPWAVWYPLRRTGAFAKLPHDEQGAILREHAMIGRAYGEADLAHDIRLACHGLDPNDNEFVVGLIGRKLYPLSHVVQAMRRTRQTSEYIQSMGPFFIGQAVWQRG